MSVGYSTVGRTSRNLLLAADFGAGQSKRVWIREGIKIAANNHYSDSFEPKALPSANRTASDLTVSTFSGALVAGIGTALGTHNTIERIQDFNYAIRPDGKYSSPRRLLFHENWLDRAFTVGGPLQENLPTFNN